MSDTFDWTALPEAESADRNVERRERPKDVPPSIVAMAQSAYEGEIKVWQSLPDKEVATLFLTLIRAAGDHTRKDGQPHPTTVLAKLAVKDKEGKEIPKSRAGKIVEFIVTERRGQKSASTDAASTDEPSTEAASA